MKKLDAIEALARHRHFGRAAEHLGVSQPTLSRHVQELEAQINERLIDRHTRDVSLTPMGQEILSYGKQFKAFQTRAKTRFEARREGKSGHVVIAALPSLTGQIIAPLLRDLNLTHPDLAIDIMDLPSKNIRETVLLDQADIGLDSPADDNFEGLLAQRLTTDALCVVANHDHPLAKRDTIEISELMSFDLIGSSPGTSLRHLTDQSFARYHLTFQPWFELNQVVSVLGLVTFGLGVAVLPVSAGYALPESCKRISLVGAAKRVTWMFRREHTPLDPAVAHVMAKLKAEHAL
ncbi:MAG: LysR family transcriptional regulator [Pseudomonadota bacterium]